MSTSNRWLLLLVLSTVRIKNCYIPEYFSPYHMHTRYVVHFFMIYCRDLKAIKNNNFSIAKISAQFSKRWPSKTCTYVLRPTQIIFEIESEKLIFRRLMLYDARRNQQRNYYEIIKMHLNGSEWVSPHELCMLAWRYE